MNINVTIDPNDAAYAVLITLVVITLVLAWRFIRRSRREMIALHQATEAAELTAKLSIPVTNEQDQKEDEQRKEWQSKLYALLFGKFRTLHTVIVYRHSQGRWERVLHLPHTSEAHIHHAVEINKHCAQAVQQPGTLRVQDQGYVQMYMAIPGLSGYVAKCQCRLSPSKYGTDLMLAACKTMIVMCSALDKNTTTLRRSKTDPLTGTLNRRGFWLELIRMIKMISRAERANEDSDAQSSDTASFNRSFGMLMFDLNGMGEVNKRYGHPAGDQLLQQVTDKLGRSTRHDVRIARLGGDELVMLTSATNGKLDALARKARRDLRDQVFHLQNTTGNTCNVNISTCIGILTVTLAQCVAAAGDIDPKDLEPISRELEGDPDNEEPLLRMAYAVYTMVDAAETFAKSESKQRRASLPLHECGVIAKHTPEGCIIV